MTDPSYAERFSTVGEEPYPVRIRIIPSRHFCPSILLRTSLPEPQVRLSNRPAPRRGADLMDARVTSRPITSSQQTSTLRGRDGGSR